MKAVRWLSDSSMGICQNPQVRWMVVKKVELACPMLQLLTSFIE